MLSQARRENRLLVNQALHSLLLWSGHREDKEGILNDLLVGLMKINRLEIAGMIRPTYMYTTNSQSSFYNGILYSESVIRLVDMVHRLQGWKHTRSQDSDPVFDEDKEEDGTDEFQGTEFGTGLSLPCDEVCFQLYPISQKPTGLAQCLVSFDAASRAIRPNENARQRN